MSLVSASAGATGGALMEYQGTNAGSPSKGADPLSGVSPEDVGQLIHHLQEEIKIIKQQLENLPGYAQGNNGLDLL